MIPLMRSFKRVAAPAHIPPDKTCFVVMINYMTSNISPATEGA